MGRGDNALRARRRSRASRRRIAARRTELKEATMRHCIRRRELMGLLAGACAFWPCASHAQQIRRLGALLYTSPEGDANFRSLRRALVDLGHVEGKNLALEIRGARGQPERLPDLAADLVRANPEVLFSLGGDVTVPLAQATRTIPIVFAASA